MEQAQNKTRSRFLRKWPWLLAIICVLGLLIAYYIRYQDNSQPERAKKIRVNKSVSDNVEDIYDKNWYKITLPEDGYISLQFDHPTLDSDDYFWAMYLYEENAKSSIPSYAHWLISGEENEQTENIGLPAGTYYIKVISHHTRCDTSTYTLRVHYTESDTYETEENNDFWLADEISVNADYCGSMMSHRDCDHYVVTIPEEGYVSLKLDHSLYESGPTWYLSLYESDQQTRVAGEAWKISSDSNFTSDAYLLPAGTYYIMITRYVISIENIIGDYTLHVNFEAVGQSDE